MNTTLTSIRKHLPQLPPARAVKKRATAALAAVRRLGPGSRSRLGSRLPRAAALVAEAALPAVVAALVASRQEARPAPRAGYRLASAILAVATGALAVGAMSIGALAIARVAVKSMRIAHLQIDHLDIRQSSGAFTAG